MGWSSVTTWLCCNCGDTPQNVSIHKRCSNGQCQHEQCLNCEFYDRYGNVCETETPVQSAVRHPAAVPSTAFNSAPAQSALHNPDPGPSAQPSSSRRLAPASERLAFSARGPLNAPALLGMSSGLSELTRQRLDYLDLLKADCKATIDEAVAKYAQESHQQSYDAEESPLEHYLQALRRPSEFTFAWELSILPFLVKILPQWLGRGYAINVLRNSVKSSARIICFTSRIKPSRIRRMIVARHIFDVLPYNFHDTTSFQFCHGRVRLLVSQNRGKDKENPDKSCRPKNPYYYCEPMMGDSIGPSEGSCTGTLGPCVTIQGKYYWLSVLHVFAGAWRKQEWDAKKCKALHPGPLDSKICSHAPLQHFTPNHIRLGQLCARSGDNLKTTRRTDHLYWRAFQIEPPEVVTDWVLISAATSRPNALRIPRNPDDKQCPYITNISPVIPSRKIRTTGRTSGHQYGQVCESPAYLDADPDRQTVTPTREWCIERLQSSDFSEDKWLEAGPGLRGDSGAPVIDAASSALYGQLWGRNQYWGPGPRVSYFTAISDIDLDIQERCEGTSSLKLPQLQPGQDQVNSRLMCLYCGDSQANSVVSEQDDENSDEMSPMSIEVDDEDEIYLSSEDAHTVSLDEHDFERDQSDPNEIISLDSDNMQTLDLPLVNPIVQADSEQASGSTNVEFDEAAIIDMILDPAEDAISTIQDQQFDLYEEFMEIDDSEEDEYKANFLARSCATSKRAKSDLISRGKKPDTSSWVMVHMGPKPPTESPSKKPNGRTNYKSPLGEAVKLLKGLTFKDPAIVR